MAFLNNNHDVVVVVVRCINATADESCGNLVVVVDFLCNIYISVFGQRMKFLFSFFH